MHDSTYTGMRTDGVIVGQSLIVLAGGIPVVEGTPLFKPKGLDNKITKNVDLFSTAVHQRMDTIFPVDKLLMVVSFSVP